MQHNKPPRQHLKRRAFDNLVIGRQPVLELLQSDKEVDSVFIQGGTQGDILMEIRKAATLREIPLKTVPVEKLNRLTGGNHQGVVAFTAEVEYVNIEDLLPYIIEQGETPLFLILDGITDIGNFGAIARTAWASGVHAVIISTYSSAPVNADAIKASAGALNDIPVCRTQQLGKTIDYLLLNGLQIIGAEATAREKPSDLDLTLPCAIVMGGEDHGISDEVKSLLTARTAIPMVRKFDSYNVSVAAGMLLYEVMRQRK